MHGPLLPLKHVAHQGSRPRSACRYRAGCIPLARQRPPLQGRPVVCLSSHTHFDHIGSTHEFPERLVHRAEAQVLADPQDADTLFDHYAGGHRDREMFIGRPDGWDAPTWRIPPAPATAIVEEGDVIDLGDRQFTVLHTPSHSTGHLSLWEDRTGTLIAQDVVYDGPLVTECAGADMGVYVATMRRLRDITPCVVHGGHFASFGAVRYQQLTNGFLAEHGQRPLAFISTG